MESLQGLKNRLKAVKNVGQITKAMEVVAATKMRKAQESALNSRPYAFGALYLLERLIHNTTEKISLMTPRKIKNTLVIVMASDRGLAGSFNSQVFRLADNFFLNDSYRDNKEHQYKLVCIGKKAISYGNKKNYSVLDTFADFGDITSFNEIKPISDLVFESYQKKKVDRVVFISTNFHSALKQEPLTRQIFPLDFKKIRETVTEIIPQTGKFSELKKEAETNWTDKEIDYIFEPSREFVFSALIPHLVEMQIYHIFLEAKASEHSARRTAMKTASDNASELTDELTINFNKARQVSITGELMEITSTMMTLE